MTPPCQAFREALEAALVIGTLMGMLESLARDILPDRKVSDDGSPADVDGVDPEHDEQRVQERRALIKQMRKTVLWGAGSGLTVAFIIGAVFLAVFYTQANDLYSKAEELWEAIFNLVALLLITPMALAILRADRSRGKWRVKLRKAFEGKLTDGDAEKAAPAALPPTQATLPHLSRTEISDAAQSRSLGQRLIAPIRRPFVKANRGRATVFTIPFVTTLREGLEGVVFIGGVSLGLPATSIPLPAIVGIACGLAIGAFVFKAGSFSKVRA